MRTRAARGNHAQTAMFAAGAAAVLAASFLGWGLMGLSTALLALAMAWGLARWWRRRQHAASDLAAIADRLPGALFVFRRSPQGVSHFDVLSRNAGAVLGVDRELLLADADSLRQVLLPEDAARLDEAIARSARELSALAVDFRIHGPEGEIRWIHSSGSPARQPNGDLVWTGYWSDITDSKRAEDAYRDAMQRLEHAQCVADLGDWTCDLATGVLTWSPQIYRMLGRDPSLPPPDLAQSVALFEDGANATADAFFKAQESGERQTYELKARLPSRETATFEVIVLPVHDATGTVTGMRGTLQDISRHKGVQEQLSLAKLSAENANRAKSDFLATMSHEIRTPLNGMLGILELVGLAPLNPDLRAALDSVRESGKSLQRIIDDILDFSKVEAGKLEIRLEPASPADMAAAVQRNYAGSASRHGLEMRVNVDPGISPYVLVDGLRLRQILGNFVSNAIKFTPEGHVELRIRLLQRDGVRETLRFEVEDTGIGISPERQQRLFQPFEQAEGDHASRVGGTGLGLVISKRLAELMGGEVGMASVLGVGTTMSLDLTVAATSLPPRAPAHAAEPEWQALPSVEVPSMEQATREGTLVLVVDDHPINRIVMRRQLNTLGYATEEVESGADAFERWQSGRFGLVLTDCNMPYMSGYELSRRIRDAEISLGRTRIPIVACSATVIEGTREACLAAGMDDYLPKPTELQSLADIMGRWAPRAAQLAREATANAVPARTRPRASKDDPAAASRTLAHFRRVNDADVALLQAAAERGDLAAVAHLAHRIKGACGFVGATALAAAAALLEQAARREDAGTLDELMTGFRQELERLNAHLDA